MFSIVIPLFNEDQNITPLLDEINKCLSKSKNYEIILINDASTDNTLETIKKIKNDNIKIFTNLINNGQSYSIHHGILNSSYNTIVTIDGDGQNNPKDILKLLDYYQSNSHIELVGGIRVKRQDSQIKIISSKIANYCSLAIRRSDFVKLGWSLNLSYYFDSLKKLKINKKNKIKIVSEDIEFANLFSYKLKKMGYNSEVLKNKSNIQDKSINDFTNLINSKNLVIANSSFSWWAANIRAVAGFDNSKICCPKLWYPKTYISHLNVQPFIPKKWKIINNSF